MKKTGVFAVVLAVGFIFISTAVLFAAESTADSLFAEEAAVLSGKKVTVRELVQIVLDNNVSVRSMKYMAQMSDTQYMKLMDMYKINLNADAAYFKDIYDDQVSKKVYISGNIMTGTHYEGGVYDKYYSQQSMFSAFGKHFGDPKDEFYGFVSLRQDLLRNAFGYGERERAEILRLSADNGRYSAAEMVSNLVTAAVFESWNLSLKKSVLDNSAEQLESVKKVRDIIANNVKSGLAEPYDLNQYNAAVAMAEVSYRSAEFDYKKAQRSILRTLNMQDGATVEGNGTAKMAEFEIDADKAVQEALEHRMDYRQCLNNADSAARKVNLCRNMSLPALSASFSAENKHSGGNPEWGAGVSLSIPVFESDNSGELRNAQMQLQSANDELALLRAKITDDVNNAIDNMSTAKFSLGKMREAGVQTRMFYDRLFEKFRQGRINAAILKTGLDSLIMARSQELNACVMYNMSVLGYLSSVNGVLTSCNIDAEKYLNEPAEETK